MPLNNADLNSPNIFIQPPEGGWGWMIVLASFLNNVVIDGFIFATGQGFQPIWEEYYQVNSGTAAWVFSLLITMYNLLGPLVSILANKFGIKAVVISGALLSVLGFILSIFAKSITVLYFTFGILAGTGFGFIYMPSCIAVSFWFDKKRATATGMVMCGSGIGTFLFAPLVSILLTKFSWQNALLILAGLVLNCVVFGCLFRPVEPTVQQMRRVEKQLDNDLPDLQQKLANNSDKQFTDHSVYSQKTTAVHVMESYESILRPRTTNHGSTPNRSMLSLVDRKRSNTLNHSEYKQLLTKETTFILNKPLSRIDIMYQGSLHHLPGENDVKRSILSLNDESIGFLTTLRMVLNVDLFNSASFVLLAVSGFFTVCGLFVPFIYLTRYVISIGHSKTNATILISVIGVTNIVSRITFGWLSDLPNINVLWINNIAITLGGTVTILVPHMQPYWLLVCYSVIFGTTVACFASLRSIILVELLGLEKLTNAFGLLLLFMGLASLIGSPIAGSLYDATGDFKLSFYVSGGLIMVSGLMCLPLRRINAWERTRNAVKATTIDKPRLFKTDL